MSLRSDLLFSAAAIGIMITAPFAVDAVAPSGSVGYAPVYSDHAAVIEAGREVPEEAEMIDAALAKQGYYREDVPLTYLEQDLLQTACEEFGVPYPLVLAVIEQETGFRNIMGDDGASAGYMQIQERWWSGLMDELGVTDLMDPYGNFRVGCAILARHMDRYGLPEALTAYNSGRPGESRYSREVMERYETWEGLIHDGEI